MPFKALEDLSGRSCSAGRILPILSLSLHTLFALLLAAKCFACAANLRPMRMVNAIDSLTNSGQGARTSGEYLCRKGFTSQLVEGICKGWQHKLRRRQRQARRQHGVYLTQRLQTREQLQRRLLRFFIRLFSSDTAHARKYVRSRVPGVSSMTISDRSSHMSCAPG